MTILYDLIYMAAVSVLWPLLVWRRIRRGPGSISLRERLGGVPSRAVSARCVWIHGVSLGEINATRTLVAELHKRSPEMCVVISSTTQTGLARARQLYPGYTVFRFPLDFSFIIRRLLNRIRPTVIVLMELELWPNLTEIAGQRGIPLVIANGRVTEGKSMRRFGHPLVRWAARRMFGKVRWVAAQDETHASRFVKLGALERRVTVCGSLKYDSADISDRIDGEDELAEAMTIDRGKPLLVCGSTGPGEEALLLDAYERILAAHATLQLVLVPRKPERFDEVAELIHERGFTCLRRSGKPPLVPAERAEPTAVFLGDTLGELRVFYSLASVVFVGRSLIPMGGSDVMEAAALAKPVLVGPHTDNFVEPVSALLSSGGCLRAASTDELARQVGELLADPQRCSTMAAAARRTIVERRGATARIVERVIELCSV